MQQPFISTEHQSEVYAGLLYAAEVIKDEVNGATKQQQYMDAARGVLTFSMNKLYNLNNPAAHRQPGGVAQKVFHPGLGGGSSVPIDQLQITQGMEGIDQVLGKSQAANKNVKGMLWYERDRGIWLTGSAEMAITCDRVYTMNLNQVDLDRLLAVFDDMMAMEWHADTYSSDNFSLSFPKGGFATFSDNYESRSATMEVGIAEKVPGVEPTAWRYLHLARVNPYTVNFATPLPAPANFSAAANGAFVSLNWDDVPGALSYRIMRDGEVIRHVSNLDDSPTTFIDDSAQADPSAHYAVVARDMGGQLGTVVSKNPFFINSDWVLASDGAANDFFGCDVAMSGNIAIIRSRGDDENGAPTIGLVSQWISTAMWRLMATWRP